MKKHYVFCFFIFIYLINSACNNSSKNKEESELSGYDVRIKHKIGEKYEKITEEGDTIRFMSYPFHVGEFRDIKEDNLHCVLLASNLGLRNRIEVKPVAMLSLLENKVEQHYIIATPINPSLETIRMKGYSDFVVKYSAVKNIIESWLLNRCGLGCTELIGWENEQYCELYLQKRSN